LELPAELGRGDRGCAAAVVAGAVSEDVLSPRDEQLIAAALADAPAGVAETAIERGGSGISPASASCHVRAPRCRPPGLLDVGDRDPHGSRAGPHARTIVLTFVLATERVLPPRRGDEGVASGRAIEVSS